MWSIARSPPRRTRTTPAWALLLAAIAGVLACNDVAPPRTEAGRSAKRQSMMEQSLPVMEAVRDLVRRVASGAPTPEIVRALGEPMEALREPDVVAVAPRSPFFAGVHVNPGTAEGVDYVLVWVELRPDAVLTVGDLKRAHGSYENVRGHLDVPRQLSFRIDDRAQPFVCQLSVTLLDDHGPEDGWRVTRLVAIRHGRVDDAPAPDAGSSR